MTDIALDLNGTTGLPDGKLAFVVTYLEMRSFNERKVAKPSGADLQKWIAPTPEQYLGLFRGVGDNWLWFGRLKEEREVLAEVLAKPELEVYCLTVNGDPSGLLEFDFSDKSSPEIVYFGLVRDAIGGGYGKWLMQQAINMAWSRPETERLWLKTCTGDSPQALGFYQSCGFKPYKRAIEVTDDPRLSGLLPMELGTHLPIIEPAS